MKKNLALGAAAACLLQCLCGGALACGPPIMAPGAVQPTAAERMAAQPVAFVGRVVSVSEGTATFEVERVLHGASGPRVAVASGTSTCTMVFRLGERWIYAGSATSDPSVPLVPYALDQARELVPGIE